MSHVTSTSLVGSENLPALVKAPNLIRYSQVVKQPMEWLWPQRIALGKLTFLVGEPGLGKGMLAVDLAARVSRGGAWPGESDSAAPAGTVLILHAEDDRHDTMPGRLEAAGADLDKIVTFELEAETEGSSIPRPFSLHDDMGTLNAALAELPDCRLVIIDPISAYLGRTDGNHNHEVRILLRGLTELAKSYQVAIVAVAHLNKRASASSINRVMGALSFVSMARTVWGIIRDPVDPEQRLMLALKNNVAEESQGMSFRLSKVTNAVVPRLEWGTQSLARSFPSICVRPRFNLVEREYRDTENHITTRLREELERGPLDRTALTLFVGGNEQQLYRAGKRLGVIKIKEGFHGFWTWMLPEHYPQWQIDNEQKKREEEVNRQRRKNQKLRQNREAKRNARPAKQAGIDALRKHLKSRVARGDKHRGAI